MLSNLPTYIEITFGLTTLLTLWLVYRALRHADSERTRNQAPLIGVVLMGWLLLQAGLSLAGVYAPNAALAGPPRIVLFGILPTVLTVVLLMTTTAGRRFTDSLPLQALTYLNVVRVPVEVVLLWLFLHKTVPQLMTFEGRNFDILAGLTAPVVGYLGFTNGLPNRRWLLVWNLLCLGLLLNIVVNALLSAPTPFQQVAFEQPNVAIAYFPFSWLPTFVVPVVLFGHLTSIRRLVGVR